MITMMITFVILNPNIYLKEVNYTIDNHKKSNNNRKNSYHDYD